MIVEDLSNVVHSSDDCVSVYYVCIHVCIDIYHVYTYICRWCMMYTWMYIFICLCIYSPMTAEDLSNAVHPTDDYVNVYYMYIYLDSYTFIHVCIYIYIYIYIYIMYIYANDVWCIHVCKSDLFSNDSRRSIECVWFTPWGVNKFINVLTYICNMYEYICVYVYI
jgi:hypothetical protein